MGSSDVIIATIVNTAGNPAGSSSGSSSQSPGGGHPSSVGSAQAGRGFFRTDIRLDRVYPHAPAKVWRALTDPVLLAAWLMRPEGFEPKVGCRFRLVAKPQPGWRGFVDCEVTAVEEQRLLGYTWVGDEKGRTTTVTWTLDEVPGGTRLQLVHAGFEGLGNVLLAKLMLGPGWKKMLTRHVPSVLDRLGADGSFRPDPSLDKCH